MSKVLDIIKNHKKFVIIFAVLLVGILALKVFTGGNKTEDFVTVMNNLNSEASYNGTVNISVGSKTITATLGKSEAGKVVNLTNPIQKSNIYFENDSVIVLNNEILNEENGGLLSIHKIALADEKADRPEAVADLLSVCTAENGVTLGYDSGKYTLNVDGTESWKAFNDAIVSLIETNKETLTACYSESTAISAELQQLSEAFATFAKTDNPANSIYVEVSYSEGTYTGNFSISVNFDILPKYISQDYFDSNQLKIIGDFTIKAEEATVNAPTGVDYTISGETLTSYFKTIWSLIFSQVDYIPMNKVDVSSNTVTSVYELGDVTEKAVFVFNKDGIQSGTYTIDVPNESVKNAYCTKYSSGSPQVQENADGSYTIKMTCSTSALYSLGKIASTAEEFGKYLYSYKGGDIVV